MNAVGRRGSVDAAPAEGESRLFRLVPSEVERAAAAFAGISLRHASAALRIDGALALDHIVEPDVVARARAEFMTEYATYLGDSPPADTQLVGEARLQVPIAMRGSLGDPSFFSNPFILSAVRGALGDDVLIGNYGVVVSLPGAPAQSIHRDGVALFPEAPLEPLLPSWAITVAIPLVAMNVEHGSTELHLGSHRTADPERIQACCPDVPEGSCLLWSYRVRHGGTRNCSAVARPLLFATYQRPWFFDDENYDKQAPLHVPADTWQRLSPEHRRLLRRGAPAK